jgi:hydroxymethylpyrimidine pyrophosphatase-like HAD family hydrolase
MIENMGRESRLQTAAGAFTGMLVTDLDGTLLNSHREIGRKDRQLLERLGEERVLRVVATGRSLYSFGRVLGRETPVDYVIFSTGAGILDFADHRIIRALSLNPAEVGEIVRTLAEMDLDYMVHKPIPENHRFLYRCKGTDNPDFQRRCRHYEPFCEAADHGFLEQPERFGRATQFVIIEANGHSPALYREVKRRLARYSVIRTTSPMDGRSLWVEVFPGAVSKALSAAWLARQARVPRSKVVAVGNDHNDADLLAWAGSGFVVANAASSLKKKYPLVASHNDNGVSQAVALWYSRCGRRQKRRYR